VFANWNSSLKTIKIFQKEDMTEHPIVFNRNQVNNVELIKSEAIKTRPISNNDILDIKRGTPLLWQFLVYLLEISD
jgi:hypothetical protein